jgi:hypothetical protein
MMKNPIMWVTIFAVVGLGIAGIVFFSEAGSSHPSVAEASRTPNTVAGFTCLVIATGLLALGAFMFRKID